MHLFSHDRFHQLPVVIEFFNCLLQGVGVFQNSPKCITNKIEVM